MSDERRDFGEYYPGGGEASYVPPAGNVAGRVKVLEGKIAAAGAAAAGLPDMDPDGGESMADVKTAVSTVKDALESLA